MQQFLASINNKKVIMFGTGNAASTIMKKLNIPIDYFVDNDSNKWMSSFGGKKVLNPDILLNEKKGSFIILVASMFYYEIAVQLENMGFQQLSDYYNAVDLFINPLDYELVKALGEESKGIERKIKNSIKMGFFKDAKLLLSEYRSLFPFDERIVYLEALIMLKEGKLLEVEKFIDGRMGEEYINYQANYNYVLADSFLKKGNYIKALEMYEKLIISRYNSFSADINSIINRLKEEHLTELKNELKAQKQNNEIVNSNGYNLHLMLDHFYCRHFIEAVNKVCNNNIFIVFKRSEDTKYINGDIPDNVIIVSAEGPAYYDILPIIQSYIDKSKQVFIHYLHNISCWLLYHCRVNVPTNWILWGADLYSFINESLYDETTEKFMIDTGCRLHTGPKPDNSNDKQMVYRKAVIRKLDSILTWNKGDYNKVMENYITTAEHRYFFYNIPVNFSTLDNINGSNAGYNFKAAYKYVFLLGNSGDPTNNHLALLNEFRKIERKDFCVVAPLSYGNELYIKNLITEGKRILGLRFIPLTDFLAPEGYAAVLNQIDAAFMNHNRQQGVGNIMALLYLGKKVYMNTSITTYSVFSDMGIKLFDIKDIGKSSLDEIVNMDSDMADLNRKIISDAFSGTMRDKLFKEYFE